MEWNKIWNSIEISNENNLYEYNGYKFNSNNEFNKFINEITKDIPLKNNIKILDLGCGNGSFSNILLKNKNIQNYELFGLDFCKNNIQYATENYNGTFMVHDIKNKLLFENNVFDLILCVSTLFYLENEEQLNNVLDEIKRVSKEESVIFLGNCMDFEKKELAIELRKKTHTHKSEHLFIKKNTILNKFNNNYVHFKNNTDLDLDFYTGSQYKFNTYIINKCVDIIDINSLIYIEEINMDKVLDLIDSLKETNLLNNPISIDKNLKIVINGHHRVSAFKLLGINKIPFINIDFNDSNLIFNKNSNYKSKCEIINLLKTKKLPLEYKSCLYSYFNYSITEFEIKNNININLNKLKTKVITFGVFDLLHIGHINIIQSLKTYGNHIIVAVQKTEEVIKIKRKPINSLEIRMNSIKALKNVDNVISYNNVYDTLKTNDIDVFIYGEDQNNEFFQKAKQYCIDNNIKHFALKRTKNISTTDLIEKCKNNK